MNYPVYEVSYKKDELHTKELLACRSYLIFQGPGPAISLGLVVLAVSAAYFFKIPLSGIQLLFLGIWFIATPYLKGAVDVWRSTKAHETFKTSLSARGVSDETARRGAVIPWSLISSIKYENGNVYFISWLGGVFVPAYAFQTDASAREFLSVAERLWNDAKQPKKIKAR